MRFYTAKSRLMQGDYPPSPLNLSDLLFFLSALCRGLCCSYFILGNSDLLFLTALTPWLSLTSESSEVSKLMSNRLAGQTARTTLHKILFGIQARRVLARLSRQRSPDEAERYRRGEDANYMQSTEISTQAVALNSYCLSL